MKHLIRKFRDDEAGAVTVDWVVLTAIVMAAAFLITVPLRTGLTDILAAVSTYLTATGEDVTALGSALD